VYFEKSYFLEPTEVGAKAFSLLKRALDETDRVALARVTIRTRERLATLRSYDDTLILETMFWPDEVRSTGALDLPEGAEAKVASKELQMARSLVESLAAKFRPETYTDAYRSALEELIAAKTRGETRNAKRRKPSPKVIDLMEALKASVDEAKKDGSKGRSKAKARPKAARKRTTKRAAAA
jgi:DNA end-binding protein Ku